MFIVLSGPSGVGKSFVINRLTNEFGFEFIVPYTSRSKRKNEVDGVDYHFRSLNDLFELSKGFRSGFWAKPLGDDIYGYKTIPKVHQDKKFVIHAYTKMALSIKSSRSNVVTFFLGYSHRGQMYHRITERVFDEKTFEIRKSYSDNEYSTANEFDHHLESDNPNNFVHQILAITKYYDY